jgi:uncharacterized membrane protein YjjP (DUF1212 family)
VSHVSWAPAPAEPNSVPVEILVRFARVGHDAGYPTADLEERVAALATALGLEDAQISATPTLVDVSLGAVPYQRSFTLRVRPTAVDPDAIARLDDLVQDILAGRVEPTRRSRGCTIETRPLTRRPVRLGAYALAGAAVAPVLGGGWREDLASGIVGLFVGAIALAARKAAVQAAPMLAPLATVAASSSAALIAEIGGSSCSSRAAPASTGLPQLLAGQTVSGIEGGWRVSDRA